MKKLLPALLIVILTAACSTGKKVTTADSINECDTLINKKFNDYGFIYDFYWYSYPNSDYRDQSFEYQYGKPIVAFNNNAYLHCQPDTTSAVKDTFNFNDLVTTKSIEHSYFNQGMHWYKINTGNKIGYMKVADLCDPKRTYLLSDFKRRIRIGFELVNDSNGSREMVSAKIFETETNKIISTSIIGPYVSTFHFEIPPYTPIDNDGIIIYRSSMQSCPGWTYEGFYTVHGDSIVQLANGSSEGEGVYYEVDVIYLPTFLPNRKVVLTPGGRDKDINLDSFPYPKDIGVPIENLIVKFSEAADEDTSWITPPNKVYERIKAFDNGDEVDDEDEFLYVYRRDTSYFEYKDGVVTPIDYPKKKK